MKEFLNEMSRELSANALGNALRDTYNRRQFQYARYKSLYPDEGEPLKNTLFWEFSKILFSLFDDDNPEILVLLNLLVIDMPPIVMNKALNVREVLSS